MKILIVACCICIGLTQQCFGDETLFTCTDGVGYSYTAEGGYSKPGWEGSEKAGSLDVIKLIQLETATKTGEVFDYQRISKFGVSSSKLACKIESFFEGVPLLDEAFVMTCKGSVSTFLFYTRSGVTRLLQTVIFFQHESAAAAVSVGTCKKGD
jgi:hypothetical protein